MLKYLFLVFYLFEKTRLINKKQKGRNTHFMTFILSNKLIRNRKLIQNVTFEDIYVKMTIFWLIRSQN